MHFLDLTKNRYTTKKYDSNKKISEENIQQLKEILRLSPSSINSQPWKFSFVTDQKVKRELANASYFNLQKINEADHLIVFSVIDEIERFERQINQNLSEGSINYYNQFLKPLPEAEIKAWFKHQVYLSLGFFLSACASMKIDSSPMEGINKEEYTKILQLNGYKAIFAVAIGYRHSEDSNQPTFSPKSRLDLKTVIDSI